MEFSLNWSSMQKRKRTSVATPRYSFVADLGGLVTAVSGRQNLSSTVTSYPGSNLSIERIILCMAG